MVGEQLAAIGAGARRLLDDAALPCRVLDANDLRVLEGLPTPGADTLEWAELLSAHGATDMWVQLARGLGERAGADQAKLATELLREVRTAGRATHDEAVSQFARARPYERGLGIEAFLHKPDTSSFPSGHTLAAAANARVMATLDPANASTYFWLAEQGATARVVGRVHHPTDVAMGEELGNAVAGDTLAARGFTPATVPSTIRLLGREPYGRFGTPDADAAARLLQLMPSDVRAAGGDALATLQSWFGAREPDHFLVF
jgi:undecaprenyl-diphosphatase